MANFSKRQHKIIDFIQRHGSASNQEIRGVLKIVSRITIFRDLQVLEKENIIEAIGKGRNVRYQEKVKNTLLRYIDVDNYFKKGPDERELKSAYFNFSIFKHFNNFFSRQELLKLQAFNNKYRKKIHHLPSTILKKELERLTIELSWKSSRIEGNTYSLIDTEILIKEHQEAAGHRKEEAIMILNHKKALDYIFNEANNFKKLTIYKIASIHDLIVADLHINRGLRQRPVGVVGTRYRPLDNEHQIKDALEKIIKLINNFSDPFSKAISVILLISYIQPFEDGNKRTARLLGNALLAAYAACPLSYRSINEADYKKAIIIFYEQNNARFFKELFMEQFKFAVENYF